MLTKNISFKNFRLKKNNSKIRKDLSILLAENNAVLRSLSPIYENSYTKKTILKFKKYSYIRVIGMGGSILGTKTIYEFLKHKIYYCLLLNSL